MTYVAHWWSMDGARLAYLTINNSATPVMEIPHFLGGLYPSNVLFPYPKVKMDSNKTEISHRGSSVRHSGAVSSMQTSAFCCFCYTSHSPNHTLVGCRGANCSSEMRKIIHTQMAQPLGTFQGVSILPKHTPTCRLDH